VASLKKDLRDKSRQVNASQGYIKQAQKEMKVMELKLETKARQISQTNVQLVKVRWLRRSHMNCDKKTRKEMEKYRMNLN